MKKVTLKKMKKSIIMVLTILMVLNVPMREIHAAELVATSPLEVEQMEATVSKLSESGALGGTMAKTALSGCTIAVMYSTSGMQLEIYTGVTQISPVVGVKDIEVQQKVWYGWKTVAVANGGEVYDALGVTCTVTYTGAQVGETYRVNCVHYADMTYDGVTNYVENDSSTGSFTYTS